MTRNLLIMTLTLSNITLHQLKRQDENTLIVHHRNQSLPHNSSTNELIIELHRVYNAKAGIGFGQFSQESEMAQWLRANRKQQLDFLAFSTQAAEKLCLELAKYPFASDGALVIAQYRSLATEYLFIGLLNSKYSVQVTDDLEIITTDYLDVGKMDIAARIDISTWESDAESNRYLTYIKGRVGRKVADFFLDFMQADVGLDTKLQNNVLMQAVEDYCADSRFEKQEKQQYRKKVFDYCNGQLQAGDDVIVKELASQLPTNAQGADFYEFTNEQGYELADSFPVDKATVRKLTKFVGAGGGLSINFDSSLLDERIFYDKSTDTLTIKGVPPNLRDQLARRLNLED